MAAEPRVAGWVALTSVDGVPDEYVYRLDRDLVLPVTPGRDRDIAPVRHRASTRTASSDDRSPQPRAWVAGAVPDACRVRQHRGQAVPVRVIGLAAVVLAIPAIFYGASMPRGSIAPAAAPPPAYVGVVPSPSEESTVEAPVRVAARQQEAPRPTPPSSTPPSSTPPRRNPAGPVAPPPSPPPQLRVVREAEASGNVRRGSTAPRRVPGGVVIGAIGNGWRNTLTFTDLTVPASGLYRVTVHYVSAEWRRAGVELNGGPRMIVDFPPTGDWATVGQVTVRIPLRKGANTLEFGNPYTWAPDLDRVVVVKG